MSSLIQLGKIETNHAPKRIGQGKAISPLFFSMRLAMRLAALSASIKKGIGQVFLSVMRERTNPGAKTDTLMLCFFAKSMRKASPQALTQALVAE